MNLKKEPVALMLITTVFSFGLCEGLSRLSSQTAAPAVAQAPMQTIAVSSAQASPKLLTRATMETRHSIRSSLPEVTAPLDQTVLQASPPVTMPLEAQAEAQNSIRNPGPLDLGLVPEVVILPEKQVPLASSGLFDKRSQGNKEDQNHSAQQGKIFL